MSFERLVRSCLYNWLGYGNINSPVWFVGMEEGGAEIWRQATLTLEESLTLRSTYDLTMDFRTVWEEKYRIPLETFRGITVWHYMAAFLLSLDGLKPSSDEIRKFIFNDKRIGSTTANHFLCEFLPLPRQSNNSILGYESVWKSTEAYRDEVIPKRFDLISRTLIANPQVQLLVSYDKAFTTFALDHYPFSSLDSWSDQRGKQYALRSLQVGHNRNVLLLATPFFGQGQCSYDGIAYAAHKVSRLLN